MKLYTRWMGSLAGLFLFSYHSVSAFHQKNIEFMELLGTSSFANAGSQVSILHVDLDAIFSSDGERNAFAKEVSTKMTEIVCVHKNFTQEQGHELYEHLRNLYGYFYIGFDEEGLGEIFVASQLPIKDLRLIALDNVQVDLIDFQIVSGQKALAHIYSVDFPPIDAAQIEDLQRQVYDIALIGDDKTCRSFLCGDLITTSLNFIPKYSLSQRFVVPFLTADDLIAFEKISTIYVGSQPYSAFDEGQLVLCGGKAEVSTSADTNGNSSAGAKVEVTNDEKDKSFSVDTKVTKDSDGNTSGQVTATFKVEW